MGITTDQYIKKPLYVEAVRITRRNFGEVVTWCNGRVQTERPDHRENPSKRYIKLQTHNPNSARQTKAYLGDWILKTDRGFKVYPHKAFLESFDEVKALEVTTNKERDTALVEAMGAYPRSEGDFTVIGPECFAMKDGSVLSWKGENYVRQGEDRTVESEVERFDDESDVDSCASPRAFIDPGVPQ